MSTTDPMAWKLWKSKHAVTQLADRSPTAQSGPLLATIGAAALATDTTPELQPANNGAR
eukprot:CAMPEP_0180822718 /NCGR_PEP_ID=MMETSP1038_2-20121128/71510_1 /TAXON_ID=632150 /ORGANISM="Azadinium spinosum, Strain 3D9" /LENGTH=58 /DNA_ID=CAMNT_0022864979 /DNA_START=129 /DNA_END=301 /DNA_ORIENTATION=+